MSDPDGSIGCIDNVGICYIVVTPIAVNGVSKGVYLNKDNTPIAYKNANVLKVVNTKNGTNTYIDQSLKEGYIMKTTFDALISKLGL